MRKHTTHFNDCGCLSDKFLMVLEYVEDEAGADCHHSLQHSDLCMCSACRARLVLKKWDALQKGGGKG